MFVEEGEIPKIPSNGYLVRVNATAVNRFLYPNYEEMDNNFKYDMNGKNISKNITNKTMVICSNFF